MTTSSYSSCSCCVNPCCNWVFVLIFNNPPINPSGDPYLVCADEGGTCDYLSDNLGSAPRAYVYGDACPTVITDLQTTYGAANVEDRSAFLNTNSWQQCTLNIYGNWDGLTGTPLAPGISCVAYKQCGSDACELIGTHTFPDNFADSTGWAIPTPNSCCDCSCCVCQCPHITITLTDFYYLWTPWATSVFTLLDAGPYTITASYTNPAEWATCSTYLQTTPLTLSGGPYTFHNPDNSSSYGPYNLEINNFNLESVCNMGFADEIALGLLYLDPTTGDSVGGLNFGGFQYNDYVGNGFVDLPQIDFAGSLVSGDTVIGDCSEVKTTLGAFFATATYIFCQATITCSMGFAPLNPKQATDAKRQARAERQARSRKACLPCQKSAEQWGLEQARLKV